MLYSVESMYQSSTSRNDYNFLCDELSSTWGGRLPSRIGCFPFATLALTFRSTWRLPTNRGLIVPERGNDWALFLLCADDIVKEHPSTGRHRVLAHSFLHSAVSSLSCFQQFCSYQIWDFCRKSSFGIVKNHNQRGSLSQCSVPGRCSTTAIILQDKVKESRVDKNFGACRLERIHQQGSRSLKHP